MDTNEEKAPRLRDAHITLEDGVATLTLNRHDVRNALTGTGLVDDILDTITWINHSDSVAVLVITGAGSAFSAGGNIKDMAERRGDFAGDAAMLAERYRQGIQRMPLAMESLEVPAIAAINGAAIGAGFDLCNMCDLRLASETARMGETFINLGLIPGDGGAWFLQRLIGYQKAAELTFTGRIIDAQEAKELGIVLEVLSPEALIPRAQELARELAEKPRQALRYTKRLMKQAQRQSLGDFLDNCALVQGNCHQSPAHLAAVKEMLRKKK